MAAISKPAFQTFIEYPINHPVLVASAVMVTTALVTGSLIIGIVAAGALYLISKAFATTIAQTQVRINKAPIKEFEEPTNWVIPIFDAWNFHNYPITWKDIQFKSAEAAYQSEKFPAIRMKEFINLNANEALEHARKNDQNIRPEWNEEHKRLSVISRVINSVFFQNHELRENLLNTGDSHFVCLTIPEDESGGLRDAPNLLTHLMNTRRECCRTYTLADKIING